MSTVLQLVQDMSNPMIAFERKGVISTLAPTETAIQDAFKNQPNNFQPNNFMPKAILLGPWCNFCEDNHDESTYEVKTSEESESLEFFFIQLLFP